MPSSFCLNCRGYNCSCRRNDEGSSVGSLLTIAGVGALVGAAAVGVGMWWCAETKAEDERQRRARRHVDRSPSFSSARSSSPPSSFFERISGRRSSNQRGREGSHTLAVTNVEAENSRLKSALEREREARCNLATQLTGKSSTSGTDSSSSSSSSCSSSVGNCCVCLCVPPEVAFSPCGHAKTCELCATSLELCPICRTPIRSRMRIYV